MRWSWLLRNWLSRRAGERLREAASEALSEAARQPGEQDGAQPPSAPPPCHVAVICALGQEAGGTVDRLRGAVSVRGEGFTAHEGGLAGRRVVVVTSGPGEAAARRATAAILAGHRPWWVVSAGFAGGLVSDLARGDFVLADGSIAEATTRRPLDWPDGFDAKQLGERFRVHRGILATVGRVVASPDEKRRLAAQTAAIAVDMETAAVLDACHAEGVPCFAARIISDAVDDTLPREVDRVLRQKSFAGRLGAVAGALVRRPSSAVDFYRLKESALILSDRLAELLESLVPILAPRRE